MAAEPADPEVTPLVERRAFSWRSVSPIDAIIVLGVLVVVAFSFLVYYTARFTPPFRRGCTVGAIPRSVVQLCNGATANAWSQVWGALGVLAIVLAGAATAAAVVLPVTEAPLPTRPMAMVAALIGVTCTLIALVSAPPVNIDEPTLQHFGLSVDQVVERGHGYGYWTVLGASIAVALLAIARFLWTGRELPLPAEPDGPPEITEK